MMIVSGIFILPDLLGNAGNYIYFVIGLIILLFSGDYLVRGGVSLGTNFRLSPLVVGIAVISLGTSAPELLVSLKAATTGHPDISVGNVVGSNITNIGLVLGITAFLIPLAVRKQTLQKDGPIMVAATILFLLFAWSGDTITRAEGLIMVILIVIYVSRLIRKSRRERLHSSAMIADKGKYSWWLALILIIISSLGLVWGADWTVRGVSGVARTLGISERVISLSVVALGTSLPELTASITAAVKKQPDISVGNIIGSNIFNLFGILGITALVKNIRVNKTILNFDIWYMLFISVLLLLLITKVFKMRLTRWKGFVLLIFYMSYLVWIYIFRTHV